MCNECNGIPGLSRVKIKVLTYVCAAVPIGLTGEVVLAEKPMNVLIDSMPELLVRNR